LHEDAAGPAIVSSSWWCENYSGLW